MTELISNKEMALLIVFFLTSMMSIGLQTNRSDMALVAAARGYFGRAILANFVILPIIGVAIATLIPLQPPVAGAIVLLACTPGGMSAIQFTGKGGPMAAGVLFLLSFLAVFVSPIILKLVLPGQVPLVIPMGYQLLTILALLVLPLLAGMLLLRKLPAVAPKLAKVLLLVGVLSFVAWMVTSGSWRKEATAEIGGVGVGAFLLLILLGMVVGWFIGGPTQNQRQIMATSTSMRNAALCFGIVQASQPGHPVEAPLIAFSMLMVFPNMLFTIYHAVSAKRKARNAA